MKTLSKTRAAAYKQNPEIAAMTDFLVQHETKLRSLHKEFKKDTGKKIHFIAFVEFVFTLAQDLVLNPSHN